jgi:hypothetical protein
MSQSEPTLTEIMRRLDELAQDVKDIPKNVEAAFVRSEVYKAERQYLDDRVSRLESRSEWIVRLIGAILMSGIITASITFK